MIFIRDIFEAPTPKPLTRHLIIPQDAVRPMFTGTVPAWHPGPAGVVETVPPVVPRFPENEPPFYTPPPQQRIGRVLDRRG